MCICGPSLRGRAHAGELRSYLLADLIRRAAELGRLHVTVYQDSPAAPIGHEDGFAADLAALNIWPAERPPGASESATPMVMDIHVSPAGHSCGHRDVDAVAEPEPTQCFVQSVDVGFAGHVTGVAGHVATLADLADRGLDPLALRLALVEHHYREQVNLSWDTIESAGKTLRRWREQVAAWACEPSAAMSRPHLMAALTAFAEDLDAPSALRELRDLENDGAVAVGAKFETFVHLDRLLGLDIAREVGKPGIASQAAGGDTPPSRP